MRWSVGRFRAACQANHSAGCRALGGEGNVPDAGFLAGVDDFDDALVGHVAIAADADRLVFELLGDGGEFVVQLRQIHGEALDADGAVGKHVDDDFALRTRSGSAPSWAVGTETLSSVSERLNCQLMMKKLSSSSTMSIIGANCMASPAG